MERLTEMHGGMMVPRKACTFDREGGADDCKECTEICEDEGGVCRTCILQECLTRLGEYEDTGLTPPEIMELKDRDTAKAPNKKLRHRGGFETFHCPNCDTSYQMDRRYTITDEYCPKCGKLLDSSFRSFCANCGQRLEDGR